MNADTVYQVFKALPDDEQKRLFEKLKEEFLSYDFRKIKKPELVTREEAIDYLIKKVFNKVRKP